MNAARFGLPTSAIDKISRVLASFTQVEKAVLCGSRAKVNFKPGSDIDLTLMGAALTRPVEGDIIDALDDLLLPYAIDLSIFADLNHAGLQAHVARMGVTFYARDAWGGANPAAV